MLVRLKMYAILKKPLDLANKVNLEQKQYVSASLLNLTFGYLTKRRLMLASQYILLQYCNVLTVFSLVISHFCCDSGL